MEPKSWGLDLPQGEDLTRHDKWLCMMYPRLIKKRLKCYDSRLAVYLDDIGITANRVLLQTMEALAVKIEDFLQNHDKHQPLPSKSEKCWPTPFSAAIANEVGTFCYYGTMNATWTITPALKALIGLLIFFGVVFLPMMRVPVARAEAPSDFNADVQKGRSAGLQSAMVANIQNQDYKTSWDEFGTNVLVDGAGTSAQIQKDLTDDIANSIQAELIYNQRDRRYLQLLHSSPEDVQAVQGDGNGDLLPANYIDPSPSLDANPGVNQSALDMPASAVDTFSTSLFLDSDSAAFTELAPENSLVPPEGDWKPADVAVFETILSTATASADIPSNSSSNSASPSDSSDAIMPESTPPDSPPAVDVPA